MKRRIGVPCRLGVESLIPLTGCQKSMRLFVDFEVVCRIESISVSGLDSSSVVSCVSSSDQDVTEDFFDLSR